jgi:NAD(P)-dependent dehydrogenase (short-subunit alcohol dehydrogenase family)
MTRISAAPVEGVLAGKVCVVTGAGAGIGRGIARLFLRAGAILVAADKDSRGLATLQGALPVLADVTAPDAAERILAPAIARGGPDVLVNNAGVTTVRPLLETSDADLQEALDVNLAGTFRLAREAVRAMGAHGRGGAIVNMASVNAMVGHPCVSAYAATKGAIHALTRQMAVECGPHGIRVNALSPGLIVTEAFAARLTEEGSRLMTEAYPVGRLGHPDDVAPAALFLASDAAAFITGADLPVDGGMTAIAPAAVVSPRIRAWTGRQPLAFKDAP